MNSTVSGTSSTTTAASTASKTSTTTTSTSSLGKDDFLKLLVTQMQNQDPMNPTDSKESIAQLAQFSALEAMDNISTSMDTLNTNITNLTQQSSLLQGAALIGKSVTGLETDGTTTVTGTVQAVQWTSGGVPQLQISQTDGTTVDIDMSQVTLIEK